MCYFKQTGNSMWVIWTTFKVGIEYDISMKPYEQLTDQKQDIDYKWKDNGM